MNYLNVIYKIFFLFSHLAKVISSLIILSFKHQKPLGGLDALSKLVHTDFSCFLKTGQLKFKILKIWRKIEK
jgi:hypothetical protein